MLRDKQLARPFAYRPSCDIGSARAGGSGAFSLSYGQAHGIVVSVTTPPQSQRSECYLILPRSTLGPHMRSKVLLSVCRLSAYLSPSPARKKEGAPDEMDSPPHRQHDIVLRFRLSPPRFKFLHKTAGDVLPSESDAPLARGVIYREMCDTFGLNDAFC